MKRQGWVWIVMLVCVCAILLTPLVAAAQVAILDVTGTAPGTYYAQIKITDAGAITVTQIKQIVRLDGTPVPDPDPDDPVPPVLSARAKEVQAAAAKATADPQRESTANGLSVAAKSVRQLISDGTIENYEQISRALAYLWDATAKHPAWSATRSLVFNELAKLAQEGADARSYGVCLVDVEAGLRASIPADMLASGELDQGTAEINGQPLKADWAEIMKLLLEIFIKYILPLIITE